MALEDIFKALEEQADRDIEAVLAEARAHAQAIREEGTREAEGLRDSRVSEAERIARSKSAQSLNSVRLESRKRLAAVKEQAVRHVFEDALDGLGQLRARSDYPAVFRALAAEALSGVSGSFEIWVDPADVDLARAVVEEQSLDAEVKPEISTAGGLVVVTDEGRVMRRNTLEDRLEKLRGIAQAEVAEILFA